MPESFDMPGTGEILFITNDPGGKGPRETWEQVTIVLVIDDKHVMVEKEDGTEVTIHIRQIKDRV